MKNSILLVDDESIFNFISTKILQGMGITDEIHVARSGNDALTLINDYFSGTQSFPRIIFLDLNMPVMDGFGFIQAFKKLNMPQSEKAVIAVVTSSLDKHDFNRARELGIVHYITKPISEQDIRAVLESAGILSR